MAHSDSYNQLMQRYVNAPYEVLLAVANDSLNKVMPIFNSIADDGKGAGIVLPFICLSIAADGKFSELEYKFISELLGINQTYDYFKNAIQQYYSDRWIEAIDKLIDSCHDEIKEALISLCLAIVAVDEKISREENAFIAKLLA